MWWHSDCEKGLYSGSKNTNAVVNVLTNDLSFTAILSALSKPFLIKEINL